MQTEPNHVVITDFRMSFGSMVALLIKLALAAIPAYIILALIFGAIYAVVAGVFMAASF